MNLNQLKYFHAVCTFQSVSAAAEHLYISQPSLSNALKSLENEFGVALFVRRHQGMELTNEGRMLYNMCTSLIENATQIENVMLNLGKKRKTIRLGIPPMIGVLFLQDIYKTFLKENPDIELKITEGSQQELLQKLSADYLDVAILPHKRPFEQTFAFKNITSLEIVCCVCKNNSLSNLESICPSDLKDIPVVLFEDNFFHTEEIKKWYLKENLTPNILLQTSQFSTLLNMITKNFSAGFMFKSLVEANSDLVSLSLESPIYTSISLVWKKDAFSFGAVTKFKEYINKLNR